MAKRARGPKTLTDKVRDIDPDFILAVESFSAEALKTKIVDLTKYQIELLDAKKEDTDLNRILEQKRVAEETYTIPVKGNKLKVNYLVELLKAKGN